jgi:hypothetical protein
LRKDVVMCGSRPDEGIHEAAPTLLARADAVIE